MFLKLDLSLINLSKRSTNYDANVANVAIVFLLVKGCTLVIKFIALIIYNVELHNSSFSCR